MNREIKFRAWLPEGDWEDDGEKQKHVMVYDLAFEEFEPVNDQLNSVENLMQYTGLKDKNGKEIYEGDIVKFKECKKQGVIGFGDCSAIADDNYCGGQAWGYYIKYWRDDEIHREVLGNSEPWSGQSTDTDNLIVVGNIYENPELIK
jgi:uncharacterized phage protein (TIGR01671 family)